MQRSSARYPKVIPIKTGITTVFLVCDKASILVDTGYPGSCPGILEKISQAGVDPRSLSLILITHGHVDHYGSAEEIRQRTGTPIALQRLDAAYLGKGLDAPVKPAGRLASLVFSLLKLKNFKVSPLKADIIIDNAMSLQEFGVAGTVISTPGHTPGSLSVILAGGDAIVGDLFMGGIIRRRRPCYPMFIENREQLVESIRKLIKIGPHRVFCSHGGPFDNKSLLRFRD